MKKFSISLVLVASIFFITTRTTSSIHADGFTGTGSGTELDPFVITTCEQLQQIDGALESYYVLGNDIDCSATNPNNESNAASIWADGKGFEPIGGAELASQYIWQGFNYINFTGILDGQNHKITNLYINRGTNSSTDATGYYVGLFGTIGVGGEVKNLGLEDVDINASSNSVGALAGGLSGTVTNVYSTGSVHGQGRVGGLVGAHVDSNNFPNSSPLVYSWNGSTYTYTDDVGSILPKELNGEDVAQIDAKDIAPKDGKYSFKIAEEYNEVVYYDELALMTFDHQPGYTVVEPLDTTASVGDLKTVSNTPTNPLVSCTDDAGKNCLDDLKAYDDKWSFKNEKNTYDKKNLKKYWILDFGDLSQATSSIQLVLRGARDYAASAEFPGNSARSVQVKDAQGNWVEIYNKNQLGSDGTPRLRTIDLTGKFKSNNYQVKVAFDTFNANYFAVDTSAQVPFTTHTYHPESTDLQYHGFTATDRTYFMNHDYSKVSPLPESPFKNQYGKFTKYGDVTPLLNATDDHFVIMRYGDQISAEFPYEAPAEGMERSFMLYNNAVYKHATNGNLGVLGQSSGYLPYRGMTKYALDMTPYPMTPENTAYINEWNTRTYAGPFADALRTHGSTIIDSYSTVHVTGNWDVGGLVGYNAKEIRRSYASGRVDADSYAGGLVGENSESTGWIHDSYATGDVYGGYDTGGFVGYSQSLIERSYSTGDVYSDSSYIGGFAGMMYPGYDVSHDSFTTSNIISTSGSTIGGFVGYGYGGDYASSNNHWFNSQTDGYGYGFGEPAPKSDSIDVFKSNTTNSPLDTWDFETIWVSRSGTNNDYPFLTWEHRVPAPVVTNIVATSTSDTSETITWDTDATSSSKILYSTRNGQFESTPEIDIETKVQSHTVSISDLAPCTTYFYKVYSNGGYHNATTTSAATFTTSGCTAGTILIQQVVHEVDTSVDATSTLRLEEDAKYFEVRTPTNFTTGTSSVVIQIKALDKTTVLGSIGKPGILNGVGSVVFDVKALIGATTTLDSFDAPVTMTYHYSDSDVVGFDESSLKLYHYHGGEWSVLDACVVDAVANTITCTTPSFSIFSLFGNPAVAASNPTPTIVGPIGGGGSVHYGCKDTKALNYEEFASADASLCVYVKGATKITSTISVPSSDISTTTQASFTRDLKLGMKGNDVMQLQKFLAGQKLGVAAQKLSKNGFSVYFGALTKSALMEYQKAKGIKPVNGLFGPKTRGMVMGK